MWHIVYLTRNLINDKIYVGVHSTWNLNDGYLGSGKFITQSIKKHGKDNFERIILHFCLSHTDALAIERTIVDLDFIKRKNTYNIAVGGGASQMGRKHSQKTKERLSEIGTGRQRSEETKEKLRSIVRSDEFKEKVSNSLKGRPKTEEHKEKLRKPKSEKAKQNMGKPKSEETKRKMKETLKNKPDKNIHNMGSKWINDGKILRRLLKDEQLPDGWVYGKINHPPVSELP